MGVNKRKQEILIESTEFIICPYCNHKYKEIDLSDADDFIHNDDYECVICSKLFSLKIEEYFESKLYITRK